MAISKQYQGVQIGGSVPQRILGQRDLSPLQNYVQARNQMWDDTIKQKSAIDVALGNLKLNAAEDKWKYDYGRKIQKKIDEAAQFGDYSRALDTAVLEAGKAVSSPEVMGRIRANEQYEKAKQEVDTNGNISALTKKAWNLDNKYHYQDTYDSEGNIVGGSEWNASWKPVEEVDNLTMMKNAISMIGISSKESSRTRGDNTTTAEGTGSSFQKVRGSGRMALSYGQVKSQLVDTINNDTKWKASLEQEYRVNKILLNDINTQIANTQDPLEKQRLEEQKNMYQSNITNDRGFITANYVDILFKKYPSLIKNFAFSRTSSTSTDMTGKDDYVRRSGSGSGKGSMEGKGPYPPSDNPDDHVLGPVGSN